MAVLVTGGSGLIGSHVVRECVVSQQIPVVLFDAKPPGDNLADLPGVHVVMGDLADLSLLADAIYRFAVDRIIHCAAALTMAIEEAPAMGVRVNIGGTVGVLEAARSLGVKRFVLVSSRSVYGQDTAQLLAEDAPIRPGNVYGITKMAAELFGRHYARQYGMEVVAVRLPVVYGGQQLSAVRPTAPIMDMVERARRGQPIVMRGGEQRVELVHVRDAARGLVLAATVPDLPNHVYNLGSGEPLTIRQTAEILQGLLPDATVHEEQGDNPGLATSAWLDISRARQELGYEPEFTFESGIREYLGKGATPL